MKQRFHVINTLIKNGANVNEVNVFGWNSLISAVNYFHEDNAIMLLMLLQVTSTNVTATESASLIDHLFPVL
jgi:hypothetical protein